MKYKKGPIFKIDDIALWVGLRQYVVVVGGGSLTHYLPDLESALEDMIDLLERKRLSKVKLQGPRQLLKAVEKVHDEFWKEVKKAKVKRKK